MKCVESKHPCIPDPGGLQEAVALTAIFPGAVESTAESGHYADYATSITPSKPCYTIASKVPREQLHEGVSNLRRRIDAMSQMRRC